MLSLIVCGGRNYNDRARVFEVLDKILRAYKHVSIIHGAARGADRLAGEWATSENWCAGEDGLKVEMPMAVPADWDAYGKSAGSVRNKQMLMRLLNARDRGHKIGVVAFPGGTGTAHMRRIAEEAGVPVLVVEE